MKKIIALAIAASLAGFASCTYNTYEVTPVKKPTPRPYVAPKAPVGGYSESAEGFRAVERPSSYSY